MDNFQHKFDKAKLKSEFEKLNINQILAFGVACCERMFPNYVSFYNECKWGEPELLRTYLDELWGHLEGNMITPKRIVEIMENCEVISPDTEDFNKILVSYALDSVSVIYYCFDYISTSNISSILNVANIAIDTIDMYVQEIEDLDYNKDPLFEQKIQNHIFMQREIRRQEEVLELLRAKEVLSTETITILKKSSSNNGRSSIGLTCI